MRAKNFIGRRKELTKLDDLLQKRTASLVVVRGRRRIGKSRLIEEFAKGKTFYQFAGLAPTKNITPQDQRNQFMRLMNEQTSTPEMKSDDWSKLFSLLAEKLKKGRIIVLFDEITWMAEGDPTFLPKLKNAWELYFKKNPKLILILCGSVSAWIEKNIMSSTGYFGRISQKMTLSELPLNRCNELMESLGFMRSPYEKFILLSLTGGIPWYIELLRPAYSAADNIRKLCFEPDGILVEEHAHIFHDLFGGRSAIYEKITIFLSKGPAEYQEITEGIQYTSSGALSEYLDDLIISGYIRRDHTWSFKTGRDTAISRYRLSDNYLRFYYKYIQPKLNQINKGQLENLNIAALPNWESLLGNQFENLVLNNRRDVYKALNINPEDIVADGPYYQRASARKAGCQIDFLIHTRFNTLFVCEIKYSKNQIGTTVINEVKEKIHRLSLPRGYSCIPVLIHINGLTEQCIDKDYFAFTVDFTKLLEGMD